MKRIVFVASFALCLTGHAFAQQQPQYHPSAIRGGCMVVVLGAPITSDATWDQPCTRGQPISGHGTLALTVNGQTVRGTGDFVAGVPDGHIVSVMTDAQGTELWRREADYDMGCLINSQCVPYQPPSGEAPDAH